MKRNAPEPYAPQHNDGNGHDEKWDQEPPEELYCPVCLLVARDAVSHVCGNVFCAACWEKWEKKGDRTCSLCGQGGSVAPDYRSKKDTVLGNVLSCMLHITFVHTQAHSHSHSYTLSHTKVHTHTLCLSLACSHMIMQVEGKFSTLLIAVAYSVARAFVLETRVTTKRVHVPTDLLSALSVTSSSVLSSWQRIKTKPACTEASDVRSATSRPLLRCCRRTKKKHASIDRCLVNCAGQPLRRETWTSTLNRRPS